MSAFPRLELVKQSTLLRTHVEDALREAIVDGKLPPGRRLPERELSETLGVSRSLIREALRQLEADGLIDLVPNKGPVVRDVSISEARDLYAIRAALEGVAARLFCEHADEQGIAELRAALDATAAAYDAGDFPQALAAKNRFYDVLFAGAGSETLSAILKSVHFRIRRWRALGVTHPGRSPDRAAAASRGLKALYGAIRRRDGKAAERLARDVAVRGAAEVTRLLTASTRSRRTLRR
jgi:GntR family transcriptional regulator, trigonelline degradation regulator